ncbi:MAG: carbamoyltransferase [Acidimicrobiales bacterium]|nr:carbamoyltransferase [Acidimicrobiales bacterium]
MTVRHNVVGISAYYHDAAAVLLQDGVLVAAAQEERFTRVKHDHRFPINALRYCLEEGRVAPDEELVVAFYDKPFTKFARLLRSYFRSAPKGFQSFRTAMPLWIRQKLWVPYEIERNLRSLGYRRPAQVFFAEHHQSHAASAFYGSPFERAAVLTMDGVGEWATSSIGVGDGNRLDLLLEMRFPHSLGLLYSAFTYFCGFKINSGEYKLMGLAPYGEPRFTDLIREEVVEIHDDGSITLALEYFDFLGGLTMTNERFSALFGGPPREPEGLITRREMDLAASIQAVTEEIVLKMARHARNETGMTKLCLAGGVALNCVANGELLRAGIFDDLWIQPAAGDAGGALGAAWLTWHEILGNERLPSDEDRMDGAYLGPAYAEREIAAFLDGHGYPYEWLSPGEQPRRVAELLASGKVIGLFQGRMEFGPRALGHRSIIGDARSPEMQSVMNLKIKFRESFRPFAPSVLYERVSDYFELDRESPYMLLVAPVREDLRKPGSGQRYDDLRQWVNETRSTVPAITHVDYSARIQTVTERRNPRFYAIIKAFEELTGCGLIINTSFNVRGEPIVCTPEDAYRCFMRTEVDYLVLENLLLDKRAQPTWHESGNWREEFVLD